MSNQTFIGPFMADQDFDVLGLIAAPYTNLIGDYFWLLFGLIPVLLMYLKAQDVALPLILGLIFTAAFGFAFPETAGIAIIMLLGTAVGAMLFQVFKGSGS